MWSKLFDISIFDYEYVYKDAFWLLLIIPLIVLWSIIKERHDDKEVNLSDLNNFEKSNFNFVKLFKYII